MKTPTLDTLKGLTRFGRKLEAIRAAGRRRRAARAARRARTETRRSQRMVQALDFLQDAEAAIRAVLARLADELPCPPVLSRSFFDGRYLLAARLEELFSDEVGQQARYFTRLSFLLEPRSGERRFALEVRATVREQDLASERLVVGMDAAGLACLQRFVEGQVLRFAEAYFAEAALRRVPGQPCDPGTALAG